jgi:hypothetical protein
MHKHSIDIDLILASIADNKIEQTIVKAIVLYAELHTNKPIDFNQFLHNSYNFHSDLIKYINLLLVNADYDKQIKARDIPDKLLELCHAKVKGNYRLALINSILWYRQSHEKMLRISGGSYQSSPIHTESGFIHILVQYMVQHGVVYYGSPQWYKFQEHLTDLYHIKWEGEEIVPKRVDKDYDHSAIVIKGILEGGYKLKED